MNYTDKEYLQALEQLQEDICDLQSSKQIVYLGDLDKALSEADNCLSAEIDKYKN